MATHSSTLGWEIPWTEEPGGLQFTGSQRHNLVTKQQQNIKSCCSHLNKGLELQRGGILVGNNNVIDDEAFELDLGRWAGF